ncbi:hypothetical protein QBC35DRAFT_514615 [Podospora australis]|uniref:Small ribosomal subunit protein uS10m n=1 Tax=Podospora australis TaxID=1536484 RepID=A0AAN7AKC5_9PEZI|nr:hypothetical protein QBC35DRAFT_514615 [Podospora australis]
MATTSLLGLPDSEIDRLLADAESRLAGNGNNAKAVTVATPAAFKAVATIATPGAPSTGEQTQPVSEVKPEKLTVRVPQLPQKNKGPADTAGDGWFNMPRTNLTPELKKDFQILKMRDVIAQGKQHFKKDNRKGFPEFSQVGTIIAGATDGANARLTRKQRKRTIVEEVLADEKAHKFKSKFHEIQEKKMSGRKGHYKKLRESIPKAASVEGHAEMNPPRLLRPLRPFLQGQLVKTSVAASDPPAAGAPKPAAASTPETPKAAPVAAEPNAAAAPTEPVAPAVPAVPKAEPPQGSVDLSRMPRALEALYLQPLRRKAEYGIPSCDLQLRSYSLPNMEFFCDFALRAAYYLGLPAFGPVPLPKKIERWTVPKGHFVHKKSQENFERITLRRLIQIKDGHPETVQVWLAFLQKYAYYGIGMKANMWEFSKLDVAKEMEESLPETEKLLESKWQHIGVARKSPVLENLEEFMAEERRRISGDQKPKVIFSGIQPTGVPHLGNYLGALLQWRTLQDSFSSSFSSASSPSNRLLFSIVDLHAITIPRPAHQLSADKKQMLASLLSIGLDPSLCTIFYQSMVPAHSELQWILSCTASTGYLSRMTQWNYPILQAADILVHKATHVPVGEDQRQHLEFARECVTNFNAAYGCQVLVPPETMVTERAKRIMSLSDPAKKMSKSDPSVKSRVLITDSPEAIKTKIMGAVTDSLAEGKVTGYEPETRPGVANLLEILAAFGGQQGKKTVEELGEEMRGTGLKELKTKTAEAVTEGLREVREKYEGYMNSEKQGKMMEEIIQTGAKRARESAEETMREVRGVVGLGA